MNWNRIGCALLVSSAIAAGAGYAQEGPEIVASCPASTVGPGSRVSAGFSVSGLPDASIAFDWVLDSVPAGFAFSSSTDSYSVTVSGSAPTTPGTYTIAVEFDYSFLVQQIFTARRPRETVGGPAPLTGSCSFTVPTPTPPPPPVPALTITGTCPGNAMTPGTTVNIPLTVSGGSGQYSWKIDSASGFTLSSTTGSTVYVQGTVGSVSTVFTVTVVDTGEKASPAAFTCPIQVTPQTLTITGACPASAIAAGSTVSIPLGAAGGSGSYSWTIDSLNTGLTLSSSTGSSVTVQGTAPAAGQYSFSVTVTDLMTGAAAALRCGLTVSVALQITGSCPTSSILAGTAFSIPLSVSGGSGSYTWTVMGAFSASAMSGSSITISGTPATAGSFPISVTVTDSSGSLPATLQCSLLVVAPVAITGPPCPIPNAIQGQAFSIPFSATGGSGSYAWSFSGPTFGSLSQTGGSSTALIGTAPGLGLFPFSVTVTDTMNAALTAVYTCSLQVAPPLTLLTQTLPNAVVGQQYPATKLSVSGGSPPLTFKVTAGNLPPGLQLDSGSGTISGPATQTGAYSFTVTVTDSANGSSSQGFQILAVMQLINTTACPLPTATELQSYSAPLTATGGTGQYVFSISGSTLLPSGLVLNQNTITGTPEGPSSTSLSIQVSSGSQITQPVSCQLTILGRTPVVTVNGFFVNSGSNLLTSSVSLNVPVQQDVTGIATLSFTPNVPNSAITDNPQVQFCGGNTGDPLCSSAQEDAAGLLRILPFTIPAGTQSVNFSPALESNVAGTIEIALSNLMMGGQALTAPPLEFTIPQTVPAILSSPQASLNGNTLQITATVSSSTCELTSATAVFNPSQGSELAGAGGGSLTSVVDLTSLFSNFTPFAVSSTHPTGGCAFTLTLPFTITGSPAAIASVDLILNNTVGAAPVSTIALQQ